VSLMENIAADSELFSNDHRTLIALYESGVSRQLVLGTAQLPDGRSFRSDSAGVGKATIIVLQYLK